MRRCRCLGVGTALVLVALTGRASATDAPPQPAGLDLWSDPTFQQQFLGTYGVQSEIEPRLTEIERGQLEKLLPLLSSDPAAAVLELAKIRTAESSAVLDFTLANLYFQLERLDDAGSAYAAAVAKFPSFRRAHKNLGLIHVRAGRFPQAIESLTRVLQLGGADALTYGLLGYAYSSTEQYLSAESAYRAAALLQADVLDWKLGLTQSVLKQQKYAEAAALCGELVGRYPDRTDFWLLQASAYIGLGQPLRAAENYEIVRHMGQATVPTLNTLGDIYVNESLFDPAASAYLAAIDLDPQQSLDRAMRAVEVLAQRGALAQAESVLARVQEVAGATADAAVRAKLLKLEARIVVAQGSSGEALSVLEEIVSLDPLDGEALVLLGQHYARADESERAIFYFERAEGLPAFEAQARIRHAEVLVKTSRYAEAVPLIKRAQELAPRDDVARYLEQVERLARTQR